MQALSKSPFIIPRERLRKKGHLVVLYEILILYIIILSKVLY